MRDLAREAHFPMKARECGGILLETFREKFHGDGLAEFHVVSAIDFAHAAFAEKGDDAVAADERGAGDEAGVVKRIG